VVGLVLVGSTAETHRVDEWSDHDFFWVVENGVGEKCRQDLSWVPDIENAVLHPRETAHGLKIVFAGGHVLEFAVFEEDELPLAGVNLFAVPVDKSNILEIVVKLAAKGIDQRHFNWDDEFELFLSLLLIGVGRYRQPNPEFVELENSFNRYRRFDLQYPELALRIEEALQMNLEGAAKVLFELVVELRPLTQRAELQVFANKNRLDWVG
jgi:hypothetical protein